MKEISVANTKDATTKSQESLQKQEGAVAASKELSGGGTTGAGASIAFGSARLGGIAIPGVYSLCPAVGVAAAASAGYATGTGISKFIQESPSASRALDDALEPAFKAFDAVSKTLDSHNKDAPESVTFSPTLAYGYRLREKEGASIVY